MSNSVQRQWAMLRLIPHLPHKISPQQVHSRLEADGYVVTERTVQRDLIGLSSQFPLVTDEQKPSGWSWTQSSKRLDIPGMDPHVAITFRLIEQQLQHQLPKSTLNLLASHFKTARGVLAGLRKEGLPAWADKVRSIPRGQAQQAPKVKPAVLSAVYESLLNEQCLDIRYTNRVGKESQGEINPIGLVFRDAVPVLICTWSKHSDDIRQLLLSRMQRAEIVERKRTKPKGFSLSAYVDSGMMGFPLTQKPITLVARFHPDAALSALETPLTVDQTSSTDEDGFLTIKAKLVDTRVLRGWLLSFGPMVEVIAPKKLRNEIATDLQNASALYS